MATSNTKKDKLRKLIDKYVDSSLKLNCNDLSLKNVVLQDQRAEAYNNLMFFIREQL